ncbi:MAG: hydantoinase/oxoprolinase family protein [Thaumarchaeota archaeon]|nr:hydantoinase/oxoprolinase family protein [Nitrososphaerota archaeon]
MRHLGKSDLSLAFDIGGTFTDIISVGSRGVRVLKLPTSANPADSLIEGSTFLGEDARGAGLVSHATTLATNALLTRSSLARTVLITNQGFRDILEVGRQRRPEIYSLEVRRPKPLIPRRDRLTVACRIGGSGKVLEPLDRSGAMKVARRVIRGGFDSVAVCFLNSYLNPIHELQMRDILREEGFGGHVSVSSEVDREYREYERTSTTVVNACLVPLMAGYMSELSGSLRKLGSPAPLHVMNSDGTMGTARAAATRPVSSIESGPAAGVVAARRLARELSLRRVISFDMGGTTAKAGTVIDGEAEVIEEFEAAGRTHSGRSVAGSGYPVRGTFIDLAEVSAGGGTVAWLDEDGQVNVGPDSAGSIPGPACYGRGGTKPTVTDANVLLGRLSPRHLLGGAMKIQPRLAERAFLTISRQRDIKKTALAVVRIVNSMMARAVSLVSAERGRDPREFTMVAFGGAGPVHACDLAEDLGITDVVAPVHAGLFSAYGLLSGDLATTFTLPVMGAARSLGNRFKQLEQAAARDMKKNGFSEFSFARSAKARYSGQSHELLLPYSDDGSLKASFDSRHRELYGYSSDDPLEVVNIRSVALVSRAKVSLLSSSSTRASVRPWRRPAWVVGTESAVRVYDREALVVGEKGVGPCVIEEYDSTLVVNPHWRWRIEDYGTRLSR